MRLSSIILLATAAAAISDVARSSDFEEGEINPSTTKLSGVKGEVGVAGSLENIPADAE